MLLLLYETLIFEHDLDIFHIVEMTPHLLMYLSSKCLC